MFVQEITSSDWLTSALPGRTAAQVLGRRRRRQTSPEVKDYEAGDRIRSLD